MILQPEFVSTRHIITTQYCGCYVYQPSCRVAVTLGQHRKVDHTPPTLVTVAVSHHTALKTTENHKYSPC